MLRKHNLEVDVGVQLGAAHPVTPMRVVLDTGAGPSIVREDRLPADWESHATRAPKSTHVCDASGQLLKARGIVKLAIIFDGQPMVHEFLVVRALAVPPIFGMDFQGTYVRGIYPMSRAVRWANGRLIQAVNSWYGTDARPPSVRKGRPKADHQALCLSRGVTIQLRCVQAVQGRTYMTGRCLLQERPVQVAKKGLRVHNALIKVKPRQDFRFYVTNLTERPVNLPKGYAVGLLEPHDGLVKEVPLEDGLDTGEGAVPAHPPSPALATAGVTEAGPTTQPTPAENTADEDIPPTPWVAYDLIPKVLDGAVRALVEEYKDLWGGQLGKLDITPHRIQLKEGARPLRCQSYRTGHHNRELIKEQVAKQLKLGVIEPSQAEWSLPVVIVPKAVGTPRFCVDYRRLNKITVKDTYPLPRMDDCIDFLGDAMVFSTMDCNAGYWQIPVAEEDEDKTTFTSHEGTFRYVRLPFGLTNAPATFQRALDMLLAGLKWKTCLVYLDDIIVFSSSAHEHVGHLREVLSLLAQSGISLKASKCHLFQEEVEYLGHIVGKGTQRVNEKNLVGLRKAHPPRTKKELRSFLGMCNVYRRFVRDYTKVARPLLAMTSPKVPDNLPALDGTQLGAFEELKRLLTSTPVLALPRRTGRYVLDTDASKDQLGAVLLQEQADKVLKPVGYWSRGLIPAEKNYSTTERECLAVVWSVFLLRPYLEGTRFTVRTDHAALKWMLHMDSAHGRLARWPSRLAPYDYVVETRAGAAHHGPDCMSPADNPAKDTGSIPEKIPCLALPNTARGWIAPSPGVDREYPPLTVSQLVSAQAVDPRCLELRREMDTNSATRYTETKEGLLVRVAPLDQAVQVYVPEGLRQEVLTLEHDPAHAGHPGITKMYAFMRRAYYWEAMIADVGAFVGGCSTCAKAKVQGRRRTAYLKLFPAQEPLVDICLELLGPFPESVRGNRFILVIVDRFTKLVRAIPIPREDAETVASAFCDGWVASYGPPDTVLTDNGPQLTSVSFRGACRMMGIHNLTSTTYHPQTQGQVERYNRTIVAQLKAYVTDHQETWDELVSILTLAYISRPQASTGVAALEFVVPDRVKNLSLERLPKTAHPDRAGLTPKDIREDYRVRLWELVLKVRKALAVAQARYKRNYDKSVQPVNQALQVGDWVYVENHKKDRGKLDERVAGPFQILRRDAHTFSILVGGYADKVSGDHVTRAPTPRDQPDSATRTFGPQGRVIPLDHEDQGLEFVWEAFVDHTRDEEDLLWLRVRWWGYSEAEDTWEPAGKFDGRKVGQYCRRVGTRPPPTDQEVLATWGTRVPGSLE